MECWMHQKKCLEIEPEGYYGFTYKIMGSKKLPKELQGKIYIGKKAFTHSTKKRVSKRIIKITKTRQRVIRGTKNSGWLNYWGSSKLLLEDIKTYGKENFSREVLGFAKNKSELALNEVEAQIKYDVLRTNSWNSWISCKIFRQRL